MVDTPHETWCARVTHRVSWLYLSEDPRKRGNDENAVDYLHRLYGAHQVQEAFLHDLTPDQFLVCCTELTHLV